ncbi:MAG TPA: ABC transporter permease [Mucilaginibacter sp.]|nr:ABC transporter permease [Mucilaginibacter sp.]
MKPYAFHIDLYDLAFVGTIFIGLNFAVLLWFSKSINKSANRFLALALIVVVLQIGWLLALDIRLETYIPNWGLLPMQFSLALGPLIYFYVLKIARPEYKFQRQDLLHFLPLLLQLGGHVITLHENIKTAVAGYNSLAFQVLTFVSVIVYLFKSHRLIEQYYQQLKFNGGDRYRCELRWLYKFVIVFGLLWLLWVPFIAVDYFYYQHQLAINAYYLLYLFLAGSIIWMSARVFLRPNTISSIYNTAAVKPLPQIQLKQKGAWLKKTVKENCYYLDPELSLGSLAEKLDLHTHELSRILNTVLKKSFNDFINEYRVAEVIRKMQDPGNDHITLLGIAFESGFNSKTTFNRTFRQMTGKGPAEYKNDLKKERPSYNLGRQPRFAAIISNHETTPKWSDEKLNRNYMFKNYLKIAWRNTLHNKVYSSLNIAGLATGMAVALLIGLWIYSQYSYDRFLPDYEQLYKVKLNFFHSGEIHTQSGSSLPLIEELKKNYPEVKHASETDWGGNHSLVIGDKKLDPFGYTVGQDFLQMFSYTFVKGNINSAFSDPNSIVLTESIAKSLFGDQDPMDKVIRIDNQTNIKVTGVMKDLPANSTLQFSYLLPFSLLEETNPSQRKERTDWENYSYLEYVELQPGANAEAFESKIKNILAKHQKTTKIEIVLHPAKDWRLLSQFKDGKAVDGFIEYVRMFGIIGILVLVIACINFVNLSTARAEKRAREVGVRKSIGSSRRDLIIQFLTESLLITFAAFALSILLVQLVLPSFNTLTYGNITIPYGNGTFWMIMLAYVLITGLLAGSRPAFYLSSFKPVKVLKGTVQLGKQATLPRKIMVVVQFTCSVALIISTLIIYQQLQYAKNRPKGYNVDRLLFTDNSNDLQKHYEALKHDLLESGKVVSVTRSGSSMTYMPASFDIKDFPGKKPGESLEMATTSVSPEYFKTVGMTFVSGHDFADGTVPDTLNIIINEAAAQRLRLKEPLNQLITTGYTKNALRIIGVVKNAIIGSPFYSAMPSLYVYNPGWGGSILYRLNPNVNPPDAIKKIGTIFDKYNPSFPFNYRFADEAYNQSFLLEVLVGQLAGIFAGLAVFISCLGLFGLSAYIAEQRKKEIGIRKVLGASVLQVWKLLSADFVSLVSISCIIASPVAFYFLHGWLQKYDYRITIGPIAFLIAAALTIVITIVTISYQAISSALINPVKSLRSE